MRSFEVGFLFATFASAPCVLALGCRERPPAPTPDIAIVAPAAAQAPRETAPAPPSASSAPVACTVRLQPFEVSECDPHPKQFDYPECWRYWVDPPDDPAECLPKRVAFAITGWQSIADQLTVDVTYDAATPRTATLTLVRVDGSILGFRVAPGTRLATLTFEHGRVAELRFGPGVASHLKTRSLRVPAP